MLQQIYFDLLQEIQQNLISRSLNIIQVSFTVLMQIHKHHNQMIYIFLMIINLNLEVNIMMDKRYLK